MSNNNKVGKLVATALAASAPAAGVAAMIAPATAQAQVPAGDYTGTTTGLNGTPITIGVTPDTFGTSAEKDALSGQTASGQPYTATVTDPATGQKQKITAEWDASCNCTTFQAGKVINPKPPATPSVTTSSSNSNANADSNSYSNSSSNSTSTGIISPHVTTTTTVAPVTTTTVNPVTTVAPVTNVSPKTTVAPVTTVAPKTTVAPVTTVAPKTNVAATATTAAGDVTTGSQQQGSIISSSVYKTAAAGVSVGSGSLGAVGGYGPCTIIDQKTGFAIGVGTIGATGSIGLPSTMHSRHDTACESQMIEGQARLAFIQKEIEMYKANTQFAIAALATCDLGKMEMDERSPVAHQLFQAYSGGLIQYIADKCPVVTTVTVQAPPPKTAPAPKAARIIRPRPVHKVAARPVTCHTEDKQVKICKPV